MLAATPTQFVTGERYQVVGPTPPQASLVTKGEAQSEFNQLFGAGVTKIVVVGIVSTSPPMTAIVFDWLGATQPAFKPGPHSVLTDLGPTASNPQPTVPIAPPAPAAAAGTSTGTYVAVAIGGLLVGGLIALIAHQDRGTLPNPLPTGPTMGPHRLVTGALSTRAKRVHSSKRLGFPYEVWYEPSKPHTPYAAVVYSPFDSPQSGQGWEAEVIGYGSSVESAKDKAYAYIKRMWQFENQPNAWRRRVRLRRLARESLPNPIEGREAIGRRVWSDKQDPSNARRQLVYYQNHLVGTATLNHHRRTGRAFWRWESGSFIGETRTMDGAIRQIRRAVARHGRLHRLPA